MVYLGWPVWQKLPGRRLFSGRWGQRKGMGGLRKRTLVGSDSVAGPEGIQIYMASYYEWPYVQSQVDTDSVSVFSLYRTDRRTLRSKAWEELSQ